MTTRPAPHGVVSVPALDLRAAPSHRSEMRSQLLLGEWARIVGSTRGGEWLRVEASPDDYPGWVRSWGLVPASARRLSAWKRRARGRVVQPYLEVRTSRGSGALVSPLYWASRVIAGPPRGRFRRIELPDGRRGFAPASSIVTRSGATMTLTERIESLMGAPYLWGGRTPFGLDCSGFTQLVLAEQGKLLPRDSGDQFEASRRLSDRGRAVAGDLVFFGRRGSPPSHVGIALGGGYFAHVRGHLRLASLDPHNPLCDNEIVSQFVGFGRP